MKKIFFLIFTFIFLPSFLLAVNKVDINTASLQQLDEIIGIGPALAQRIVGARPFSSVDDLLRVKGIGEKTLQKIKDQGLAEVYGNLEAEIVVAKETTVAEPTTEPVKSNTPLTYPTGVILNEILPSPEGADDQGEWIEIYNSNNFEVDLSDWKIEDKEGTKTTYTFNKDTKISPNGYLILRRPDTNITLNNSIDGLNLLWPDNKIIDSMAYEKAPTNQSYNKTISGWQWSTSLTPGYKNIIATTGLKNSEQALPNSEKSGNSNKVEAGLSAINESINQEDIKSSNPWFLFFTAILITIISASFVLFIKFKLK